MGRNLKPEFIGFMSEAAAYALAVGVVLSFLMFLGAQLLASPPEAKAMPAQAAASVAETDGAATPEPTPDPDRLPAWIVPTPRYNYSAVPRQRIVHKRETPKRRSATQDLDTIPREARGAFSFVPDPSFVPAPEPRNWSIDR